MTAFTQPTVVSDDGTRAAICRRALVVAVNLDGVERLLDDSRGLLVYNRTEAALQLESAAYMLHECIAQLRDVAQPAPSLASART